MYDYETKMIEEYFTIYEESVERYGPNTLVIIMVGGFYEIYCTDKRGPDLDVLSKKVGLVKSKKKEMKIKNLYMAGFNLVALDRYRKKFLEHGYHIVQIDQVTPAPNPKREIVGVYSPGTYIETDSPNNNHIVCIYIQEERQTSGKYLPCIGLSSIDVTTGKCTVYEAVSGLNDDDYAFDETYRFILAHDPKEYLIVKDENTKLDKNTIFKFLDIEDSSAINYRDSPTKDFKKICYQNNFLQKVYADHDMLSPIESANLSKLEYGRVAFIHLLDFVYQHDEHLLDHIEQPYIFEDDSHLIIGNNAIHQLNILSKGSAEGKIGSLFDVVNHTSTPMGRRFLNSALAQPSNKIEEIQERYDATEVLIKRERFKSIENVLNGVGDIERLGRKLFIERIQPYELFNLVSGFKKAVELSKLLEKVKIRKLSKEVLSLIDSFIDDVESVFEMERLRKESLNKLSDSFFKEGIYPKIDNLRESVVLIGENMEEIGSVLSTFIEGKTGMVQLKKNARDGYYFTITQKRCEVLKNAIKGKKSIKINDNLSIKTSKLEFKEPQSKTGSYKIFFDGIKSKSNDSAALKEKLLYLVRKNYKKEISKYRELYSEILTKVPSYISFIDFIKSNAKTATLYGYCKPEISDHEVKGFIEASKLRHPIVERIRTDIQYIPHDICIGKNGMDGMLLYGLNSAGKSTFQKSVGTSIIMAQTGLYVAAEKFTFSPYKSIFARMTGNDDIFKGLSQFTLEMTELDAILKRNNPKTLVIGDEVCRSTESTSGNIIVSTTVISLALNKCSFIFATHLHEIAKLDSIKNLDNVGIFHLSVEHDKKRDILIFDRTLKPGSGSNIYGLTVARYIIKNDKFHKLAEEIKKEISGRKQILSTKKSKFNSKLYVDSCQICGKTNDEEYVGKLDVHHINHQSKCNKLGFVIGKSYLKKDELYNLVVLCKKCHYKAHHSLLDIRGYKDTTKGRILDYEMIKYNGKVTFETSVPKKFPKK